MKILHINDYYAPVGGVETYLLELIDILDSRGFKNAFIYQKEHPRTPPINGKSIYHIPINYSSEQLRRKVSDIVYKETPDIVYLHDVHNPEMINWISQLVPTIGYIHIFFPVCPGLGKLFRRGDQVCEYPYSIGCIPKIYLRRCASARHPGSVFRIMRSTKVYLNAYRSLQKVVVASNYMQSLLLTNQIPPHKITILPYFINIPDQSQLDKYQPDPNKPSIFFAGRLEYEKGLNYLIDVIVKMRNTAHLYIAGDGSLKSNYVQLAQELNVADRVHFLGWLSDGELAEYYQRCAVTVMPTLMPEPFGKVGVEAMANRRPAVAFDVGGIPDWLKDGYNGFIVPPRDVEKLASKIDHILENPNLAAHLGANGRQYVEDNYSVSKHVEGLELILTNAIGSK